MWTNEPWLLEGSRVPVSAPPFASVSQPFQNSVSVTPDSKQETNRQLSAIASLPSELLLTGSKVNMDKRREVLKYESQQRPKACAFIIKLCDVFS